MDMKTESVEFAEQQLAKLTMKREVAKMLEEGLSPDQLAHRLGLSMRETRRWVFATTAVMGPSGQIPVSPAEVVYEAAVGMRSRESMLKDLTHRKYTYARDAEPDNPLSARTIGTWDDLLVCLSQGLLTEDEYVQIQDAVQDLRKAGWL